MSAVSVGGDVAGTLVTPQFLEFCGLRFTETEMAVYMGRKSYISISDINRRAVGMIAGLKAAITSLGIDVIIGIDADGSHFSPHSIGGV